MNCDRLYRISAAAKELQIPRSTLATGIERGEINVFYTACGLALVELAHVEAWSKQERKIGRPKSSP